MEYLGAKNGVIWGMKKITEQQYCVICLQVSLISCLMADSWILICFCIRSVAICFCGWIRWRKYGLKEIHYWVSKALIIPPKGSQAPQSTRLRTLPYALFVGLEPLPSPEDLPELKTCCHFPQHKDIISSVLITPHLCTLFHGFPRAFRACLLTACQMCLMTPSCPIAEFFMIHEIHFPWFAQGYSAGERQSNYSDWCHRTWATCSVVWSLIPGAPEPDLHYSNAEYWGSFSTFLICTLTWNNNWYLLRLYCRH
jgi:hypothetical protein